jgi:hypothetical protein
MKTITFKIDSCWACLYVHPYYDIDVGSVQNLCSYKESMRKIDDSHTIDPGCELDEAEE